jgi:MFS family permease
MRRNVPRLYFFSFFTMFFISLPVWVPYFQAKGFTMQDVFTVQAIFALAVALFEIPSGYFCDLFGRRKTLIFGGLCYGVAFTWLAFADTFFEVVLFELGAALAFGLISGADVALLYESLDEDVSREEKAKSLGNMQFAQLISEASGAILGGVLAATSLALPFQVQAAVAWFPLVIALTLVEGRHQKLAGNHRENFGLVFRHLWSHSPEMRRSSVNLLVWGLSTFLAVWMLQKYWETSAVPVAWFGALWAIGNLLAAFTSKLAAPIGQRWGRPLMMVVACALPVVGYFGMGLTASMLGVVLGFGLYLGRGFIQVVMREEFNHHLPNEFRATANSVQSFMFRIVFFVLGPLMGMGVDRYGVQAIMLTVGVIFLALYLILILGPLHKRGGRVVS